MRRTASTTTGESAAAAKGWTKAARGHGGGGARDCMAAACEVCMAALLYCILLSYALVTAEVTKGREEESVM
jgi:hypothetical protein